MTRVGSQRHSKIKAILMAAIPLCLLLRNINLFSLTQHRFIGIQDVTFMVNYRKKGAP